MMRGRNPATMVTAREQGEVALHPSRVGIAADIYGKPADLKNDTHWPWFSTLSSTLWSPGPRTTITIGNRSCSLRDWQTRTGLVRRALRHSPTDPKEPAATTALQNSTARVASCARASNGAPVIEAAINPVADSSINFFIV